MCSISACPSSLLYKQICRETIRKTTSHRKNSDNHVVWIFSLCLIIKKRNLTENWIIEFKMKVCWNYRNPGISSFLSTPVRIFALMTFGRNCWTESCIQLKNLEWHRYLMKIIWIPTFSWNLWEETPASSMDGIYTQLCVKLCQLTCTVFHHSRLFFRLYSSSEKKKWLVHRSTGRFCRFPPFLYLKMYIYI